MSIQRCCDCNSDNIICDGGIFICTDCGSVQHECQYVSTYKEACSRIYTKYQYYKRSTHFREFLIHLSANERTEIDNSVIKKLQEKYRKPPTKRELLRVIPKKYSQNVNKINL